MKTPVFNAGDLVFVASCMEPAAPINKFGIVEALPPFKEFLYVGGWPYAPTDLILIKRNHNVDLMKQLSSVNSALWEATNEKSSADS